MLDDEKGAFDPVERLVTYHAAINALDFATIEAMFAEDAIYVSGGLGGTTEGRDAIMAGFRSYFDAYPDQVAEDDLVEALDASRVRAVWRLSATNANTREKLLRAGEETVTFGSDGRIVRVDVTDD
jgi:ketosteroid isomerase-like protein